ncbi:MAG: flagellar protein FliS [Lachnospiraceae bacterium]|nr:flagellar protein FliS [Lachnospiraceae bacterium]
MTKDDMIAFNRRITESNPTQLICVFFDMYFAYEKDALTALEQGQQEEYIYATRHCSQVVEHLRSVLDFNYEISKELFSLYTFVEERLAKAMYLRKPKEFAEAAKVMQSLQEAFEKVAQGDGRKPLMENTQQVTVGLTYGRNQLNESVAKDIGTRGYWA